MLSIHSLYVDNSIGFFIILTKKQLNKQCLDYIINVIKIIVILNSCHYKLITLEVQSYIIL